MKTQSKGASDEAELAPDPNDIKRHLEILADPCREFYPDGLIEIQCIHPTPPATEARLFGLDELDRAVAYAVKKNGEGFGVYAGINPRKPETRRDKAASNTDVEISFFNFADFDDEVSLTTYRNEPGTVANFEVHTGTTPHDRRHVYYRRAEPCRKLDEWRYDQKLLRAHFKSDSVIDPRRVMRLVGTVSYPSQRKADKGYIAELVTLHENEDVANRGQQEFRLLFTPVDDAVPVGVDWDKCISNARAGRNWHNHVRDLVASMVGKGLRDANILAFAKLLTLQGYTVDKTREELQAFIDSARAKYEKPEPGEDYAEAEINEELVWVDPDLRADAIEERPWLVGSRLLRGQLGVLAGPGSSGKSTLILTTALAIATGKPLTGEEIHAQGRVLIINNEDTKSEMERRLIAAREHFGITLPPNSIAIRAAPECIDDPEELRVAVKLGKYDPVKILEERLKWLEDQIVQNDIVYCSLDPLISLTRGISSIDNDDQGLVLTRLRAIAFKTGCAIEVAAHTKKPQSGDLEANAGDQTSIRGASSIVDTARIVYTVTPMGKQSVKNLPGGRNASYERVQDLMASYFRLDGAKANLAKKEGARWFYRVSYELPNGESVGVVQHLGNWSGVMEHAAIDAEGDMRPQMVGQALIDTLVVGEHRNIKKIFDAMKGDPVWPWSSYGGKNKDAFAAMFAEPVKIGDNIVVVEFSPEHQKSKMFLRISASD